LPAAEKAAPAQDAIPAQAAVKVVDYNSAPAQARVQEAETAADYSSAQAPVTVTAVHCTSALASVAEYTFAFVLAAESLFLNRPYWDARPAASGRVPATETFPHLVVMTQVAPVAAAQADHPVDAHYRP